jgi:hypothetical protein
MISDIGLRVRVAMSLLPLFLAFAASALNADGITAQSNCLPPAGGEYAGGVEQWVTNQGTINLANPIHNQFTTCETPQSTTPGGMWTEAFNSMVSGELFVNGNDMGPVSGSAAVIIGLTVASDAGGVETLNTQMTELDINLGGGDLIRIDPTTPSTGQTTITDLGGGNFQIQSFFDIFTDLSLDGGNTWYPSSGGNGPGGGALMTLQEPTTATTPEPGTFLGLGTGLLGLGVGLKRKLFA